LATNDRDPIQSGRGGNPGNHLTQDNNRVGSFSPGIKPLNVLKNLKKSRPRFFVSKDCRTFTMSPNQTAHEQPQDVALEKQISPVTQNQLLLTYTQNK
jgi:hypothetical protein